MCLTLLDKPLITQSSTCVCYIYNILIAAMYYLSKKQKEMADMMYRIKKMINNRKSDSGNICPY